jgi:hypothetical protein
MGNQHMGRPEPRGFPAPSGMAEQPGGALNTQPLFFGGFRDPPGGYGNNPAGNIQSPAEFPYRPGVPPAFRRRTDTVFNVDTAQPPVPFPPQDRQGGQHGGGIGTPRNGGQQNRSPGQLPQPGGNSRFKTLHTIGHGQNTTNKSNHAEPLIR